MGRSKGRWASTGSRTRVGAWALGLTLVASSAMAEGDLLDMSLEELMNIEVTSVSKKAESKNDTAAAITVITAEDIRRGGFTSIPEALRVVPGVQVARIDASRWAISIRGFRQEFSNKLLVLVDGRPVYTPLFGGAVWSEQNLAMQDVERIEVIRGPGGAIWGANAVNGVINIMTRHTKDTQGQLLALWGGTQEYGGMARHGGSIGDDTTYRVTVKGEKTEDYDFDQNYNGDDEWTNLRVGIRSDTQVDENATLETHFDFWDIDSQRGIGVRDVFFSVVSFNDVKQRNRGGVAQLTYDRQIDEKSSFEFMTFGELVDRRASLDERSYTFQASTQYNRDLVDWCDGLSLVSGIDYR
ncbi:MAG: TonB-dependent receptor plug domain-containing protein, partial [bacterium]|nr:TonB-dependent receptor plug domain-containing protein [bacterium]